MAPRKQAKPRRRRAPQPDPALELRARKPPAATGAEEPQQLLSRLFRVLETSNEELRQAHDELKRTQARLVQSEKMASLGELVAGVAHELNNPLSFVHGAQANLAEYVREFVKLLRAYEKIPITDPRAAKEIAEAREGANIDHLVREAPKLLEVCLDGTRRLKRIVDDLRTFARADRGERTPTNVNEAVESTVRLLAPRIREGGVSVRVEHRDQVVAEIDASQINQVWMNLLANALDAVAGRPEPKVTVSVRRLPSEADPACAVPGEWVEIDVSDNGAGIPPESVGHVFEPFYTTKSPGSGTGLGLSIAYGIVRAHRGTIAVSSSPDTGTTFTVRLPLRQPAPGPGESVAERLAEAGESKGEKYRQHAGSAGQKEG